ncbi:hypothetical protein PCANC_13078 [Puccinia coronata f. sp. avenae]|uniref:Thioredoxin n=1 Tax=Puccinia coronata f. sp. avenae TaxID=200324 RepID=A0A2N5UUQ9_9BASI|nr:hypothetical protein PCANC_13078 [Puccinia coronata f. sp. avenae]
MRYNGLQQAFPSVSLENKPIVIEFWAAWCASCKHIGPTFEGLSDQWSHKLTFVLVDVDDKAFGFEFSRGHGVRAMPTFQIIVDGVKVSELVGADQEKLVRWLLDCFRV